VTNSIRLAIAVGCATWGLSCSSTGDVAEPQGPAAATISEGIEYRASTAVLESFPVQLHTIVDVTNRSGSAVDVVFPDGCIVLLRAFQGTRPVPSWDQQGLVGCTQALIEVHFARGASRRFETRTDARAILGDSLSDGQYRLEAYLRPSGKVVRVDAGVADLAIPR
jgi:hypothetical protein